MEFSALSNRVIGCAIEVHRELGPGLLESTCEQGFLINFNVCHLKQGLKSFIL